MTRLQTARRFGRDTPASKKASSAIVTTTAAAAAVATMIAVAGLSTLAASIPHVNAHPQLQSKIPNGDKVQRNGVPWPAVAYDEPTLPSTGGRSGGGGLHTTVQLNSFGMMMLVEGMHWTQHTCEGDADGDGYTNGEELGDPDCVWTKGQIPTRTTDISHPGYADSVPKTFQSKVQIAAEAIRSEMATVAEAHREAAEAAAARAKAAEEKEKKMKEVRQNGDDNGRKPQPRQTSVAHDDGVADDNDRSSNDDWDLFVRRDDSTPNRKNKKKIKISGDRKEDDDDNDDEKEIIELMDINKFIATARAEAAMRRNERAEWRMARHQSGDGGEGQQEHQQQESPDKSTTTEKKDKGSTTSPQQEGGGSSAAQKTDLIDGEDHHLIADPDTVEDEEDSTRTVSSQHKQQHKNQQLHTTLSDTELAALAAEDEAAEEAAIAEAEEALLAEKVRTFKALQQQLQEAEEVENKVRFASDLHPTVMSFSDRHALAMKGDDSPEAILEDTTPPANQHKEEEARTVQSRDVPLEEGEGYPATEL